MRSSERAAALLVAVIASAAAAQASVSGFAVERLFYAPAGAGWISADELKLEGGLGGAMSLTLNAAHDPLHVSGLAVVRDEVTANIGASLTYGRFRVHLDLSSPLNVTGQSGTAGRDAYTAPDVTLSSTPDGLSDAALGGEVRIFGAVDGPFRLGASAVLFVPTGFRERYDSDGTVRALLRVLVAGGGRAFSYAANVGVHIRPLDDAAPQSPKGSELTFAAAAGPRLTFNGKNPWSVLVGPELFGATAFQAAFGAQTTALELMLSARLEGARVGALQARFKLAVGTGINRAFGAADWRVVGGVEMFGR